MLQLVIEEFAEVFHIHFALTRINNGCHRIQHGALDIRARNGTDDIGELTDTRGLNDDTLGMEFLINLRKRLGKITDKRAADTAGIHLGNVHAGILKKSAVNADFAKFVLDENNPFAGIRFLKKLLYQCGFSCTQETGKNINFCHTTRTPKGYSLHYIIVL